MIEPEINEISSKKQRIAIPAYFGVDFGSYHMQSMRYIRAFVGAVKFSRRSAKSNSFEKLRSAQEMSTIGVATVNYHDVRQ